MAETVKVVRDGPRGWHLINKQDFDPAKHVLWEPEIAAKEAEIKEGAEAEKEAKRIAKEAEKEAKRIAKEAEKEAKRAAAEAAKKAAEEAAQLNQPVQDK